MSKVQRNLDGVYFRVKRDGKWENVCYSDMEQREREEVVTARIAERIDAEHERQLEVLYRDMSDAEYVKLPVDADGEPIHVGDVMENLREDLEPKLHHRFKVYSIQYRDYGQVCTLTEDSYPSILYRANECRHYHASTVEDVLSEMLDAVDDDRYEQDRIIAEYATKLRLAGDAE